MEKFVRASGIKIIFLGVVFLWSPAQAELVFNIQHPDFKQSSRDAGASLFSSIAEIFQMLSAVERRDDGIGDMRKSAIKKLAGTVEAYRDLAGQVQKSDRILDYRRLPEDRIKAVEFVFRFYGVKIPNRESQVIILGFQESENLLKSLVVIRFKSDEKDRQRAESIIIFVDRILFLGTVASEVGETAP